MHSTHNMMFAMFNPCIDSHLLVDNAIALLNDMGVMAEVARYHTAIIKMRQNCIALICVEDNLRHSEQCKLSSEGYLFHMQVSSQIHHLVMDPSLPPSPDPATTVLPIITSEGPSNWGTSSWIDPPSVPLHYPLHQMGPCTNCSDMYYVELSYPFAFQCHCC
jgi:hypothetical protein